MLVLALALQIAAGSTAEQTANWVDCLSSQVEMLEPSGESASAIAEVSISECYREERNLKAAIRTDFETSENSEVRANAAGQTDQAMALVRERMRPKIMQLVMTLRANARS